MEYVHIVVALILAVTVVVRCVCVIADMKFKSRTRAYCPWAGFGISYALLCVAAAGSFFHIAEGAAVLGDWLWLVASAGLIAFDRRANTNLKAVHDPNVMSRINRARGESLHSVRTRA